MKGALANLEKMEDTFFTTVGKACRAPGSRCRPVGPGARSDEAEGHQHRRAATQTVEQMLAQAQTTMRAGRATGLRAAQVMMESYATLVSGVLIGMSEGLQTSKVPRK